MSDKKAKVLLTDPNPTTTALVPKLAAESLNSYNSLLCRQLIITSVSIIKAKTVQQIEEDHHRVRPERDP